MDNFDNFLLKALFSSFGIIMVIAIIGLGKALYELWKLP
jgi:hypothetical protein